MEVGIKPVKIDELLVKITVMKAQGFDKIDNLNDPRYLDYFETLDLFKALSTLADKGNVEGERESHGRRKKSGR